MDARNCPPWHIAHCILRPPPPSLTVLMTSCFVLYVVGAFCCGAVIANAFTLNEELVSLATIRDVASDGEMVRLLDAGANAMLTLDVNGESILHLACIYDTPGKVKLLLERGADPNYRATKSVNLLEMTPLSWCVYGGYTSSVQEILNDARTIVNMVFYTENGSYVTALDIALKIGEARGGEVAKMLRSAGGLTYAQLKAKQEDTGNERDILSKLMPSPHNAPVKHYDDEVSHQDEDFEGLQLQADDKGREDNEEL